MTNDEQAFWDAAAIAAMQALIRVKPGAKFDLLAEDASEYADAMLALRKEYEA